MIWCDLSISTSKFRLSPHSFAPTGLGQRMSRAFTASLLLGAWSDSKGNIDRTERQKGAERSRLHDRLRIANSKSLKPGPLWKPLRKPRQTVQAESCESCWDREAMRQPRQLKPRQLRPHSFSSPLDKFQAFTEVVFEDENQLQHKSTNVLFRELC